MNLDRESIRQLQAGLHLLGFEGTGTVDGIAGRNTNTQINALIEATGAAVDATDLNAVLALIQEQVTQNPDAQERLRALAENPAALNTQNTRILQAGMNFNGVTGANGQPLKLDGINGTQTRHAAAQFAAVPVIETAPEQITPEQTVEDTAPPAQPLNSDQIRALQGGLLALGIDTGGVDGRGGPRTRSGLEELNGSTTIDTNALAAVTAAVADPALLQRLAEAAQTPETTAQDITALQAVLHLNGHDVDIDGRMGGQTRGALETALAAIVPEETIEAVAPESVPEATLEVVPETIVPETTVEAAPEVTPEALPETPAEVIHPEAGTQRTPGWYESLYRDILDAADPHDPDQNALVESLDELRHDPAPEIAPVPEVLDNDNDNDPTALTNAFNQEVSLSVRTVANIEAEQRAILESSAFGGLDTSVYLDFLHNSPDNFDSLHDTFRERAGEVPFYAGLSQAMDELKELEEERQTLMTRPAEAYDNVADIEAAQQRLLSHPYVQELSRDNPDYYLDMMRNNPNLFDRLLESTAAKAEGITDPNSVYNVLADSMTGLRNLETQRMALLGIDVAPPAAEDTMIADVTNDVTNNADTPVIALPSATLNDNFNSQATVNDVAETVTPDVTPLVTPLITPETIALPDAQLVHQDHPFGFGGDTMAALLISSMDDYRGANPQTVEAQFMADRLKEIYGGTSISMNDAASTLYIYREADASIDYSAIERTVAEMGIDRHQRFDLDNPADMNRVLTGLAALSQGGMDNVTSGTAAAITAVSGHDNTALAQNTALDTNNPATENEQQRLQQSNTSGMGM